MSYDVTVGPESFNYTSNISKLFYDHIPGGLDSIHGKRGREAGDIIARGILAIEETRMTYWENGVRGEPEMSSIYDAKNGWGSLIGGILFLSRIMATCYQFPDAPVEVCA